MNTKHYLLGFSFLFFAGFAYAQKRPEANAESITFYQTDLVCRAAPHIGCGSKSKPILLDFMKLEGVKEAWLNRAGTVIAVVWEENAEVNKNAVAAAVFNKHGQSYQQLLGKDYQAQLGDFQGEGKWYKGVEVDELTREEMEYVRKKGCSFDGSNFNTGCCTGGNQNSGSCGAKSKAL